MSKRGRNTGLLFLLFFLLPFFGNTQPPSTHQWIDYSNSYYKIKVAHEGIHRIPYSTLSQMGLDTVSAERFQIYYNGQAIPVYVGNSSGPVSGSLSPGDFIAFYGQSNTGELDSNLYRKPQWHPHAYTSFFTDTSVYFLTHTQPAQTKRFSAVTNDTSSAPVAEDYFYHKSLKVFSGNHVKPARSTGSNTYISDYVKGEGEAGSFTKNGTRSVTLATPFKWSNGDASFKSAIITHLEGSHEVDVAINGNNLYNASLDGQGLIRLSDQAVPNSYISTNTTLDFKVNGKLALTHCQITYPRKFNFGGRAFFSFQIQGTGKKYITIDNFNDKGTRPVLYDRTNQLRIKGPQGGNYNFVLPDSSGNNQRKLVLTSQDSTAIYEVNNLEPANFVNLNTNQGQYAIISHKSLRQGGKDYVSEYAKYRSSPAGGGYDVVMVNIEQLYDQFAYGVKKHPLSIRYFVNHALDNWSKQLEQVFLIGQSLSYSNIVNNKAFEACLVPSFGKPASDNMLVARNNDYRPRVGIGRLAADKPKDVRIYYEKVKELEKHQRTSKNTPAGKLWMKRILHFGGGSSAGQQSLFRQYLNNYKSIIENPYYGGHVTSFFKTSSNPIEIVASEYIDSLMQSGVSMMTFFGHSSPGSFDISVDNPSNFTYKGKYPFLLSNGCYSGNIHSTNDQFLSKRWVILENKGAIGFLAMSLLSYGSYDNRFSKNFYQNLSRGKYHQPVGSVIKQTIKDIYNSSNSLVKMTAQQFTYHGDPAVQLNTHAAPDYYLNDKDQVSFSPPSLSVELDSFDMVIDIANLGKALDTNFMLRVKHTLPDNKGGDVFAKSVKAPYYKDKVRVTLPVTEEMVGLNDFTIKADWQANSNGGKLNEISESNNTVAIKNVKINSTEAIPIYPYEFSIVPNAAVKLKASTVDAFAPARKYIIQIDTTEWFNSPELQRTTQFQKGGVIQWKPDIDYRDSTVYYWRITPDTLNNPLENYHWNHSSFIYMKNSGRGWNQSHHFQYLKDELSNVVLPDSGQGRRFRFVDEIKNIQAKNMNARHPDHHDNEIYWSMNLAKMHHTQLNNGACCPAGGGVMIVVIDSSTGLPWLSYHCNCGKSNGMLGEKHCRNPNSTLAAFEYCDGDNQFKEQWADNQLTLLDSIPAGDYVLVMGVGVGQGGGHGHFVNDYPEYIKRRYRQLGFPLIDSVNNQQPFIFFTQKGESQQNQWNNYQHRGQNGPATVQLLADSFKDVLELNTSIEGKWSEGYITSPPIGPAKRWKSLHWKYSALETPSTDDAHINIIGITKGGKQEVVMRNIDQRKQSLQNIDPQQYPYLKLRLYTKDDSSLTPVQLDYWRVLYDPVPEAAVNPQAYFNFDSDTLAYGEKGRMSMQIENVSDYHMDSLLSEYQVFRKDNSDHMIPYPRQDSLLAHEQRKTNISFNTYKQASVGNNTLFFNMNPRQDQVEKFHFNNMVQIPFYVQGDNQNPLLDVTFDGRHILNGDIVSAQPHIEVELKDENKYLALDDTSLVNVWIKYPNETTPRKVWFSQNWVQFIPAKNPSGEENTALIKMNPTFKQDGDYELIVQGKDKSNNRSGSLNYNVQFEVINKSTITNVLNYPNPFTSSTRFVFTLTGSQLPSYFKIQIMTITGKVVREITLDELNNIHIGRNITDYAWDGTDEYGDPLGNGLYLYRIVAKINGKSIEHRNNESIDQYFENGFGKMYLMR